MALILGHYERLVTAIGKIDRKFLRLILSGQIAAAAEYVDLRFLLGLLAGILTGVVGLASAMHYLLQYQQAYIYSIFFGLILASSFLVAQRLKRWHASNFGWLVLGVVVAGQICLLSPVHGELTPWNAFLAAAVAICAMILPGISGAFVLLLLGLYHPITELIKGLPHGQLSLHGATVIAAFGAGCGCGLLAFTRLLKWLLAHKHDQTMSILVGLMLGSLVKIWPFQRATPDTAMLPFKEQVFRHLWPSQSNASIPLAIALAVLAMIAALLLERLGARLASKATS